MYAIPIAVDEKRMDLVLLSDDIALARIKSHDPFVFDIARMKAPWNRMAVRRMYFAWEEEAGMKEFIDLLRRGHTRRALDHLLRGYQWRPDLGDHDGDYLDNEVKPGERGH